MKFKTIWRKPDSNLSGREFYLRSFTWGLPVNIGGMIVAAGMLLTGHKPQRYGNCINFTVGKNWGGGSMGIFMLTCQNATDRLKAHEHGHSIQNCFYGPLMPLINLLSSTRFLCRKGLERIAPNRKLPPYDSAWFEGEATRLGNAYMRKRKK